MPTAEEIFIREFKRTVNTLPTNSSIFELPNPLKGTMKVPTSKAYKVKGIEDETFSALNGEIVEDMGKLVPERSVLGRNGKRQYDEDNNVIKEKPKTPSGSIYIRTSKKIAVPYGVDLGDFNYADAWGGAPDDLKYVYAVPKDNLYIVNMTALAVSTKKLKCYHGHQFKTWNYGTLSICVIPYNPNASYTNTIILGVRPGLDYDNEIKKYVNDLIEKKIIPDVGYYNVSGGIGGDENNIVHNQATPTYAEYEEESQIPISEQRAMSYETATALADNEPEVSWE